jgi:hypothetical protein
MSGERAKSSRREALPRRFVLSGLLCAAIFVLSGCHWGSRHNVDTDGNPGTPEWVVTVHQQNTNELIWRCEAQNQGNPTGRANCALDIIRFACHADPINFPECDFATDHSGGPFFCRGNVGEQQNCNVSMARAIEEVIGPRECLFFEYEVGGPSRMWAGLDSGNWGCP